MFSPAHFAIFFINNLFLIVLFWLYYTSNQANIKTITQEKHQANVESKYLEAQIQRMHSESKIFDRKATEESKQLINDLKIMSNQLKKAEHKLELKEAEHQKNIEDARADTIKRSRATIRGQATEHLAPIIESEWPHKDYRFIGNPIDYVIFNGASAVTDKESDIVDSIIFLEIKTGKSKLNKVQRRIRDTISKGRVYFGIYNPDNNELKMEKNDENDI